MRIFGLFIISLSLASGCCLDEQAIQRDFSSIPLRFLCAGQWQVPAQRLLLAPFGEKIYGLDIVNGTVFVTDFPGGKSVTKKLFTLPVGCGYGEIFNPVAFQPLSSGTFLIADRYKNRLHLFTEKGKKCRTLTLSPRGFFPSGNHIAAQIGVHRGAVLFFDPSAGGEIFLVRTTPFRVESFTGKRHSPLPSNKSPFTFHPFFGDLVHTKKGFYRLTYSPSLYLENGSGPKDQNTLFYTLQSYGYQFALNPGTHLYKGSFLKPLLIRTTLLPVHGKNGKEALILFFDDPRRRVLAMDPENNMKKIISWPDSLPWKHPHLIPGGAGRLLFYGDDRRFFLYQAERPIFP
ncbi:MAG TPA: hypothetical protein ENL15_02190 [Firmicutes bacterium]|nr:hypothetical protein [Bacillota bacterium]